MTRDECAALDAADPLKHLRERFVLPQGLIYLDGNSLGALPKAAPAAIAATVEHEWGEGLIRSWLDADWFTLPERLGDRLGGLIGAAPGQTVVCDTTSINIYKALHAAMSLRPGRRAIVAEAAGFPTDLYMVEGAMAAAGGYRRRLIGEGGANLTDLLDDDVAAVLLTNVDYRTGALLDMPAITEAVHAAGAVVIWDLCHSAGIMPLQLDDWGVDLAVGCTYKYLNGGPGAPAFVYAATRHHEAIRQPLSGWWGHAAPFAFERDYRPVAGIKRFLCGTQPVLSLKGVEAGLATFDGVAMQAIREKSQRLTGLFMDLVEARCAGHGLRIVTPRDPVLRGSQVSIAFEHGYAVVRALIERGVIGDFRTPDIMRFGLAPSYLRQTDIFDAVELLADCLERQVWREERYLAVGAVT